MNRIDRLFNILILLQTQHTIRAQDLAAKFELSERTIYRDIAALMQMGVPIIGAAGEGYRLMDGYYLPPLIFTPEEASMMLFGIEILKATGNFPDNARSAFNKINAVLPEPLRYKLRRQAEIVQFFQPSSQFDWNDPLLEKLRQAIIQHRVIQLTYHSLSENETTSRAIEPYFLTYGNGAWYVTGYCRLRQDERAFRLDRIEQVTILAETFPVSGFWERDQSETKDKIQVKVRFNPNVRRWVSERQHYAYLFEEDEITHYQVENLSEIRSWLLGWGTQVNILEPEELRQQILAEAENLVALLKSS